MNILERAIEFISPKWALERQAYRNAINAASTQYAGAARTTVRGDWNLGPGTATPPTFELETLRNRSRDANRNDPLAVSITNTMGINVAGSGLQLQSKLRADRLGVSEEQADEYRRQIEDGFERWAQSCDAADRLSWDEMQLLVVQKIVEDGEILTVPTWKEASWRPFGRALELVAADRLAFKTAQKLEGGVLNDTGVTIGTRGEPISYSIRKANSATEYVDIKARDTEGRPMVIHNFRSTQPGQLRGVPLIAPVMVMLKDFAGVMEATVMRARVAACLAVIFTKANPLQAMLGNSKGTTKETDAAKRVQELFPGMVHYQNQGDTATMLDPSPDGGSFDPFVAVVVKLICASIGLPYELVIKDFSKTNYSSARAAILEGRRVFTNWRKWLGQKWCQPIFELVLEEMVLSGFLKLPKWDRFKAEYSRAMWIGGGWGWVDPVKEIEASNMAIESGLSTLADECAGQGKDWEENLSQRRREIPSEEAAGISRKMPERSTVTDNPAGRNAGQTSRRAMILAASLEEK